MPIEQKQKAKDKKKSKYVDKLFNSGPAGRIGHVGRDIPNSHKNLLTSQDNKTIVHAGNLQWIEEGSEGTGSNKEMYCVLSKVVFTVYRSEEDYNRDADNPCVAIPLVNIASVQTDSEATEADESRLILTINWKFNPEEDRD